MGGPMFSTHWVISSHYLIISQHFEKYFNLSLFLGNGAQQILPSLSKLAKCCWNMIACCPQKSWEEFLKCLALFHLFTFQGATRVWGVQHLKNKKISGGPPKTFAPSLTSTGDGLASESYSLVQWPKDMTFAKAARYVGLDALAWTR